MRHAIPRHSSVFPMFYVLEQKHGCAVHTLRDATAPIPPPSTQKWVTVPVKVSNDTTSRHMGDGLAWPSFPGEDHLSSCLRVCDTVRHQ